MNSSGHNSGKRSISNTVFIWLCAAGLTTALMAFLALLLLIVIQGLAVFIPKPIAELQLKSAPERETPTTIAGVLIKETVNNHTQQPEWQLLLHRPDGPHAQLTFIPTHTIESISYPDAIAVGNRIKNGPLFFYPLSLQLSATESYSAEHPSFSKKLQQSLRDNRHRLNRITQIERSSLNQINSRLYRVQRELEETPNLSAEQSRALEQKRTRLEADSLRATSAIAKLEQQSQQATIQIRLPDNTQEVRFLSEFAGIEFTNTLNPLEKCISVVLNIVRFLSEYPRQANTAGGIFPAIVSTFVMTLLMSIVVMPFGVIAAIYLREYARQGPLVRSIRIGVNNLAGVPSIVYGVFGLGFFIYIVGGSIDSLFFPEKLPAPTFGTGGILWASLTLALMTVPVVIVATEEALATVPHGTREASMACGASQLQTLLRVVLPASGPGILTGLILAIARGAGEVAPLMLVGVVKLAPGLPLDGQFPFLHLERKFMHLGYHIFDLAFQSPHAEAARPMVFATTLLLILLVIVLNIAAIVIRKRLRARLHSSTF
jgi:phosphate transport system permease protein